MLNAERLHDFLFEEGLDPSFEEEDTEVQIQCTFCDRPKLYINAESGGWLCFRCGEAGGFLDFLRRGLGLNVEDALERERKLRLPERERNSYRLPPPPPVESIEVTLPEEFHPMWDRPHPGYVQYLEQRGVPLDLAMARNIGYCASGYYRHRVIVPVETGGHLYTFVARSVVKRCFDCGMPVNDCDCDKPLVKVLTPKGGHPRATLYQYDPVRLSGSERVVVVEGVFDALRLPTSAVAILGSSISPEQVGMLSHLHKQRRQIILCLDGDEAGQIGTAKAVNSLLSALVVPYVVTLPDDVDPGSLEPDELETYLNQAVRQGF